MYGPIKNMKFITDLEGRPRGYAFIEFENEKDMKCVFIFDITFFSDAFTEGDAKKIDGKRVVVDVERGRTVNGWRPRRLGGGLGRSRKGGKDENVTVSGRYLLFLSVLISHN